jgi:hypothetical protein
MGIDFETLVNVAGLEKVSEGRDRQGGPDL